MLRLLRAAASFVAGIVLAFCLAAAGLWVCCLPVTTEVLARATAGSENPDTPFNTGELVDAALAGRDYTVGNHNIDDLLASLWDLNVNRIERSPAAAQELDALATQVPALGDYLATHQSLPTSEELMAAGLWPTAEQLGQLTITDEQIQSVLGSLDLSQVLDTDAISHLDDVNAVISKVGIGSVIAVVAVILLLVFIGLRGGKRWIGGVLTFGGLIVIVAFVAVGLWAVLDFNGMFSALHSVFFSQGNWMFDMDSLLITMYPTSFWIGMGLIWLIVTLLLSSICVAVGLNLRK